MLHQGPRHGYEIKKDVERALGGMVPLNNKTLYLTLKRFEEMGAVTRQVIQQEGRPNRHLYELTERGSEVLQTLLRDFGEDAAGSDAEFFTRVSFFDFLEVEARKAILRARLAYLQRGLEYLNNLQQIAEEGEECAKIVPTLSHAERVLAFHTKRIRDEYEWIAAWLEELQATN